MEMQTKSKRMPVALPPELLEKVRQVSDDYARRKALKKEKEKAERAEAEQKKGSKNRASIGKIDSKSIDLGDDPRSTRHNTLHSKRERDEFVVVRAGTQNADASQGEVPNDPDKELVEENVFPPYGGLEEDYEENGEAYRPETTEEGEEHEVEEFQTPTKKRKSGSGRPKVSMGIFTEGTVAHAAKVLLSDPKCPAEGWTGAHIAYYANERNLCAKPVTSQSVHSALSKREEFMKNKGRFTLRIW